LLVLMYVWMFCAICRYSVLLSVPMIMVSVAVLVLLMFIRLSVVGLLVLFSCIVVCVSSCRNVAWFTIIPLMLMYSGSVL